MIPRQVPEHLPLPVGAPILSVEEGGYLLHGHGDKIERETEKHK